MAYYTPPGGRLTAEFARSFLSGPTSAVRYSRPAIPTSVVLGHAAQRAAALRAAQQGVSLMMSGMGLGMVPSINVRALRTAIPAALASRRRSMLRAQELQGLGGKHPAAAGPPIIRRQAGFFMGPGGGPGGGPFQFPGFTMSGMGLADDGETPLLPPDFFKPSRPIIPAPKTVDVTPPDLGPFPPITLPPLVPVSQPLPPPGFARPSFFNSSTLGIPNTVLAAGVGALLLLGIVRRSRRNPSSSGARKYGRSRVRSRRRPRPRR